MSVNSETGQKSGVMKAEIGRPAKITAAELLARAIADRDELNVFIKRLQAILLARNAAASRP